MSSTQFSYWTLSLVTTLLMSASALAGEIQGTYVEARTCQVYTGPCFANGEVGLTGKNAVMSWRVTAGQHQGVDLEGYSVAVVVKASHTLGFQGLANAKQKRAFVFVDNKANARQQAALHNFAISHAGIAAENVLGVTAAPIEMNFDSSAVTATVEVGKFVKLNTRKARPGDCICSNESAYYPPLVKLKGSAPGVTIDGDVTARRLGTRWSIPDSRTAYLGVFEVKSADLDSTLEQVAAK